MPRPPASADGVAWGAGPWALGDPGHPRPRFASPGFRLWAPVVLSALVQLPVAAVLVRLVQPDPWIATATIALAAVGPLALIAARRLPGPVAAVATAAAVGELLVGVNGGPPPLALVFALAAAVVRGARVWAWVSLAVGWATAFAVLLVAPEQAWSPLRIVGTTLGLLLVMGIGESLRTRRERAAEFRAVLARRRMDAAEAERMRIARELHDVLAHSLSQINVQAGVGLHLAESRPEQAVEALAAIKQTSKTALDDVRTVLGMLRDEGEQAPRAPQPSLDGIPALVASVEIPGARVELVDRFAPHEVPAAVGAAAYRIVQEALTNVGRHGVDVGRVTVRLDAAPGGLLVEVDDDGTPGEVVPGRGLLGMRERVELLGGRFETDAEHGFTVRAVLPTGGAT
ncbi:sensor histidine kinase [Protaetiibacter intestinalis]|uniref:histidine kinase n=1 Tax=Protaetiibacter intestinalis TaxID=2419774 RepID=A0A387BCU8_9MICO|nr:sensor histidine kinase [Protaetiibacter intestinalis]AYF98946.1 sensor histidine kinase [Protaetiibacter intestinalis]